MKIKELQKTVNIAWSPQPQYPIYLAAGSAAQQIDSNSNTILEIYATNLSDPSFDLQLKAAQAAPYRFQKLIWSPTGHDAAHRNGLLVGGCESGHVLIYSAAKLLAQEDGLIARQDKHTGAVSGLDFNPFQTNLLASSAAESEIFIWDLNNTSTHMNPGAKTQPLEDVQNVAWNRQVQHILASVFSSRCVIWDLRKSEQIIKLSDTQSRVRWHAIEWHPKVATQLWLASEDDQAPVVQLWDLRYATAPAKTLQIHQRGVLGMSWCPSDTDLMVSCGKDNHIYCWNPNSEIPEGEILSEVASSANWYANVHWCPRNPALIAASSLEGDVSIYSLFGGTQQQVQTANKIADSFPGMEQLAEAPLPQQSTQIVYHDLTRAPKMLKRACGVSFGFGGKLVSFNGKSNQIQISQVVTNTELVARANALEQTINEANFSEYCRKRADEMPDQHGRYLWYFIKANFEQNPRAQLLNLLGYNTEDIDNKFAKFAPKEEDQHDNENVDNLTDRLTQLTHQTANNVDNNTVFDIISQKQQKSNDVAEQPPAPQFKIPTGDHSDSLISEALLTGNLEAAVELCLEADRTSEALIIASTLSPDYLTNIQTRYLQQQQTSDLSHVISALVTHDWLDFVSRCSVECWKEALVAALKHGERKVVDICERLGDRLLEERATDLEYVRNALLCFICAGSIDKLVTAWYHLKQVEQCNDHYKLRTNELQELAELVLVMAKALEQQGIAIEFGADNQLYAEFIADYSELLVSQGALQVAQAYIYALTHSSTVPNPELEELHERIYCAVTQQVKQQKQPQQTQQPIQQTIYGRQQHARGSFSQQVAPQVGGSFKPPGTALPLQTATPRQSFSNESVTQQPPRPLSTLSSQGANTGSGLVTGRSKYIVDPSVANGPNNTGFNQMYNPAPQAMPAPAVAPTNVFQPLVPAAPVATSFNTNPFNANSLQSQPAAIMQPNNLYNKAPYGGQNMPYIPGVSPLETAAVPPPPLQTIQRNPTPPPGWNDPPAPKSRAAKKTEGTTASAPITHPLFGVDPNQNPNAYMDPNAYQHNRMPAPPMANNQAPIGDYLNPTLSPLNNNLLPGATPTGNNLQQNYPPQMNFQTSPFSQQPQQQIPQQWNATPGNMSYGEDQHHQQQQQQQQVQRQPEPPKEKQPLPEEYVYLQTVLEELKTQCLAATNDPRTKRKFVDVNKRLENLYDCLRDGRLSLATIGALNQIVQCIQIGDYANALHAHTQIAFGSDFIQCAGFMPGLKVLVQSASDLQIVLR